MNPGAAAATPAALHSTIFLVEDEPVLRKSLASGLSKLANVEVLAAGTVNEAVAFLDERAPSLLISDIDLPGASGLDLISEFGRRDIHIPIILITAYLNTYRDQIPTEPNVLVLEKPIPLQDLRMRVSQALSPAIEGLRPPFNLLDCVQLACLRDLSARIEIQVADGRAEVIIHKGEVWAAADRQGRGAEVFNRLAFVPDSAIKYTPLFGEPGARNITVSWERLVLDLACPPEKPIKSFSAEIKLEVMREGSAKHQAHTSLKRTLSGMPQVPPEDLHSCPAGPSFDELWTFAVDALLNRQYVRAMRAFRAAGQLRQGHRGVLANISRLQEMGYDDQNAGGTDD